jgi:endonuclease YncB( thermonuclease family)
MILLAAAALLTCTSPAVIDGDSLRDCQGERVRLHGMDARERGQPFSTEATRRLMDLTRGPVVCTVTPQVRDRYGRAVAVCAGQSSDIGGQLVREGLAIDLRRYSRGAYADEEAEARAGRKGMWQ